MSSITEENFPKRLERVLAEVPNEHNRELIRKYNRERKVNGIAASTRNNDISTLRNFCQYLGDKDLEDVEREDVLDYLDRRSRTRMWRNVTKDGDATITHKEVPLSEATLAERKIKLRQFFKWLRGTDDYPAEVAGLSTSRPDQDKIPVDELITPEDIAKLIQAHEDRRDKAILAVLYESGLRSSEFCALNIRSVKFDKYGAVLTLPKDAPKLKTGARRVRLIDSVTYLKSWYEHHPRKDEPEAPLFFTRSRRAPGRRMSPNALWQFTQRAAKKAGLSKHIYPHLFRHSAATERARAGFSEHELRAFFGWSRTSDMPSRYVHLAGLDYEQMLLKRRGLLDPEDDPEPGLRPKVCKSCGTENPPTQSLCEECNTPVSPEAEEIQQEQLKEQLSKLLASEMKDEIAAQVRAELLGNDGGRGSVVD